MKYEKINFAPIIWGAPQLAAMLSAAKTLSEAGADPFKSEYLLDAAVEVLRGIAFNMGYNLVKIEASSRMELTK